MMASTSHRSVCRVSSFITCSLRRAAKTFRVVLMHLSHIPPWWDAAGGLNIHFTPCWRNASRMRCWFHWVMLLWISFSPPTNLVPLSLVIRTGLPLLATKRRNASMNESVSREWATSMCTARTVRQVNKQPYRFTWDLACFTRNGPERSTPTWLNGGRSGVTLSSGRSAIFWSMARACLLLQSKHLSNTFLTLEFAFVNQNLPLRKNSTYSLPEWPDRRW